MRVPRQRLLASVLALAASAGVVGAQQQTPPSIFTPGSTIPVLESYLESLRLQAGIPGMSAAVVRDGEIAKAAAFIRPDGFDQLPVEVREIGPSYRAANPEGVKTWLDLEHKALSGPEFRQRLRNEIKQERLKELKLPTLLIAGAADLFTPPSISRMIAAELPNSRLALMPESGHSSYWEEPELFNRAVLDFINGQST